MLLTSVPVTKKKIHSKETNSILISNFDSFIGRKKNQLPAMLLLLIKAPLSDLNKLKPREVNH